MVTRSRGRLYRTWHPSTPLLAHIGGTPDEQVRLDGMQIENSIAYQSSTIRILTDTPVLAEKNGFPGFPSWYWWRVRLMLEALAALAFPTGLSVQFGDQASRLNTTTVIKNFERLVAAKTDGSPVAVAGGARVDPSVPEAVRLPYSGFYSIRGGSLGTNGTTLVLRCGSSYNAHSHKDAGTFELASWGNVSSFLYSWFLRTRTTCPRHFVGWRVGIGMRHRSPGVSCGRSC